MAQYRARRVRNQFRADDKGRQVAAATLRQPAERREIDAERDW
ncbi:hypothetical protein [Mycobacterium paraffinicum]|nr:hypothetical protein [Mycobacterium paraffinicum]